jgi:hypothetical protein
MGDKNERSKSVTQMMDLNQQLLDQNNQIKSITRVIRRPEEQDIKQH